MLAGSMTHGNEGFGYTFGVEGGKRIAVGNGFWLAPQVQLAAARRSLRQVSRAIC
ncbi:autotransporter outer membrane beta-barrel domain-containing protein [Bradyrhizobium cenepequi]